MSYESPIKIIEGKLTSQIENDVIRIVQSYDIDVNKAELLRALQYDREQYEKGFEDGRNYRYCEGVKPYFDGNRWHCGECSIAIGRFWTYCQKCGQKIGWNEVSDDTRVYQCS